MSHKADILDILELIEDLREAVEERNDPTYQSCLIHNIKNKVASMRKAVEERPDVFGNFSGSPADNETGELPEGS